MQAGAGSIVHGSGDRTAPQPRHPAAACLKGTFRTKAVLALSLTMSLRPAGGRGNHRWASRRAQAGARRLVSSALGQKGVPLMLRGVGLLPG